MDSGLSKKFRIKPGDKLHLINAPQDFDKKMGTLPLLVKIAGPEKAQQVHWFVKNKKEVEKQAGKVVRLLIEGALLWVYFPKGNSGKQTDLTRDKGWDALREHQLQFLTLVSFDETWSAFALRKPGSKIKTAKAAVAYPDHIDTKNRTIKIPADLAESFKKHDRLKEKFMGLAFSHKKEYIEWILSAKREETRKSRIAGTLERLEKGLKNPSAKLK